MIELIKFEIKKIFNNKLVLIAAIAMLIAMGGFTIMFGIRNTNELGTKEEVEALAEGYLNGDYSKEDINKLLQDIRQKVKNDEELSKEEKLLYLCPSFEIASKNAYEKIIESINNGMERLRENNEENTFKYNNLLKQKEMLESLPKKESIFYGDWMSALDFNMNATIKIILLTVGLAGIFSKEYSSRVTCINLSSKNGKTKLNTAKMIAALIYANVVFIFSALLCLCSSAYLGLPNGDKPISFITGSIYNISIRQFYLDTLAINYFGTIVFAIFIVLTSLFIKNILVEFGLPIILYFVPTIFKIPDFLKCIDFSKLFSGKSILGSYEAFNVFGNVVLYPYVIIVTGVIAIIVMLFLYKILGKNQTIA